MFWKLGPNPDKDNDTLLLRIPKLAVLSPKNSFIYPLLVDYECKEPTIDLTVGMHAIVITYIYEKSMGEKSPWAAYLDSIEITEKSDLPVCLWEEAEKQALFNTEVDLVNMLDASEIINFYLECVKFAHQHKKLVAIPDVLSISPDLESEEIEKSHKLELLTFGRYVQAVISRAFAIDKYHGLSLVPGADLFNHLSPVMTEEGVEERENVHFECDDDDEMCELCGEIGCSHMEEESEEEGEDDEISDTEMEENEIFNDSQFNDSELELDLTQYMELDVELDQSSESDNESSETESIRLEAETERDDEEVSTVSDEEKHDFVKDEDADGLKIEESDDEENGENEMDEDDEEQTESAETESYPNDEAKMSGAESDLAAELSDSAKCCDIVLESLPSEEYDYELFNTYGNELSNAYLLQRYGFVSLGNPNTSCLLSVQMFAWLKKNKKKQLDMKLEWYEAIGFEIVNELCAAAASEEEEEEEEEVGSEGGETGDCCGGNGNGECGENEGFGGCEIDCEKAKCEKKCGNECEDKCQEECQDECQEECQEQCCDEREQKSCQDKCCDEKFGGVSLCEEDCQDSCCDTQCEPPQVDLPESWQLSPKIMFDGTPTEQTIALIRLFLLPFKVFHYKLATVFSERKLEKRVARYLLEAEVSTEEIELLVSWVQGRLDRYKEIEGEGERFEIARELASQERKVLERSLEVLTGEDEDEEEEQEEDKEE